MSIVMQMRWKGVTPAQYDQVREIVAWERDPAPGGALHVAWFDDDGLRVWDVWESADAFGAFTEGRLTPGVAQVGIETQPDVTIAPLHCYQKESAAWSSGVVVEGAFPDAATYDALSAKVDWLGTPPAGGIAHVAVQATDGSIETIAVWTSEQANADFLSGRVADAAASLGMPADDIPQVERLGRLHAVFHPGGASGHS